MKKILIAIIVAIFASWAADAQLSNTNVRGTLPTTVGILDRGFLMVSADSTYLVNIASTNQFDDPFIFYLGNSKASTIKTAEDLAELISSTADRSVIDFSTCDGKHSYSALVSETGGEKYLIFRAKHHAGSVSLELRSIERIPGILNGELDPNCLYDYKKGENVLGSYKSGGGDVLWDGDEYSIGIINNNSVLHPDIEFVSIGNTKDEALKTISKLIKFLSSGKERSRCTTSACGHNYEWFIWNNILSGEDVLAFENDFSTELNANDLDKIVKILNGEKVKPTWKD